MTYHSDCREIVLYAKKAMELVPIPYYLGDTPAVG